MTSDTSFQGYIKASTYRGCTTTVLQLEGNSRLEIRDSLFTLEYKHSHNESDQASYNCTPMVYFIFPMLAKVGEDYF